MNNLRDLYERLLEIPEHERERWLAAHCDDAAMRAKLWALLEAGDTESADPLARPAAARLAIFDAQAAAGGPHWIGQRVGAFRLRKLIGQGGMAAVFLAISMFFVYRSFYGMRIGSGVH